MRSKSRKWFDGVSDFLRHSEFTIGFLTGAALDEDILRLAKRDYSPGEFKKLKRLFECYYTNLPPTEDFEEEKSGIFRDLVPKLRSCLSFVETAVSFGRVRGDIDLALISEDNVSESKLIETVKDSRLPSKYPLVDWDTLLIFRCKDGTDFGNRLLKLKGFVCDGKIPMFVYEGIGETIENAKLLWGNGDELRRAKEYFSSLDTSGKIKL